MRSQLRPDRDQDVYAQFDRGYGVQNWRTPGSRREIITSRAADLPADAPDWWMGDEEASQSFLVTAGVKL